ncbi:gliding motility-associated C-terminal domain-containing protein [Algoriphagus litoralis]|uniref:gliding motility-associated C-terminal domain-containing protein n=1 Tax=Algoriphagus litoralis TaxID=2202829 RepID=UPI0013005682|nr:gliding motility-associated C-terminal domain-containing protein [Algoriphagus litoralis]
MKKSLSIFFSFILFFLFPFLAIERTIDFDTFSIQKFSPTKASLALNDPELSGPDRLCNVFGSVLGSFFGGGNPATDVYSWEILGPSGQLIFSATGGGGFQTLDFTFSQIGIHTIKLTVSRGGIPFGALSKPVELVKGPELVLEPTYVICENQEIDLIAIDSESGNFSFYEFEWKNESGDIIGNENVLKVNQAGSYSVVFFFINSNGEKECSTQLTSRVSLANSFSIESSASTVCPDQEISFFSQPVTNGKWSILKNGETERIELGESSSLTFNPSVLMLVPGDYTVFMTVTNSQNPACTLESSSTFIYYDQPRFEFLSPVSASGCQVANGAIRIKALTAIDQISIENSSVSFGPLSPGDEIDLSGLKSGSYTVVANLGSCSNALASVVPLDNPPEQLKFDIVDIEPETCTATGKIDGAFTVNLLNGPINGFYRLINEKGAVLLEEPTGNQPTIKVAIAGGTYFFELYGEDDCTLPQSNQLVIKSLEQTNFEVPASIAVCQTLDFTPVTAQEIQFTITEPDGTSSTFSTGEVFPLTQAGTHTILGTIPNQSEICPTLKEFDVTLVAPVDFEPVLISQDCFGNRTYEANINGRDPQTVKFRWFDENNNVVGTGQFLDLDPFISGNYSLDVQPANSSACPIPPIAFEIKKPVLSVEVNLTSTKLCEFGPRAILSITTTDFEEVTDIEWRRFNDLGEIETLPQFKNQTEIIADVEGVYEAAVFSIIPAIQKNCELGRSTLNLDLTPQKVEFTIPNTLSICDPYELVPQSVAPLTFTLTLPDGSTQTRAWNEAFEIIMPGTYTLLGYNPDVLFPLCPEQKTFIVTKYEPVQFNPELVDLTCEGIYEFTASLANYTVSEVDIFWKNQSGAVIGTDQTLFLSSYGTYSLEVQPKGSLPCQISPLIFEAPEPVLSVATSILAEPLCPDQTAAALAVNADLTEVSKIEWWFTSIDNDRVPLTSDTDKTEILAIAEGTYEVILRNQFGCQLGRDQVLILRSQDTVRPVVENSYQICPRYGIGPVIDPGNFASYEWYFEESLVANSPTFKPLQVGNYRLVVFSSEGCAYETNFVTEEECELRVAFPDAIQPGNPDKPFLIYTNYLIDELEIWIFNKWGQMIFHCKQTELISEESTCVWDGLFDGEKIPPGSYAFRMTFRNYEKNIVKEQLGSIFVID